MPVWDAVGHAAGTAARRARSATRRVAAGSRWAGGNAGRLRSRMAGDETGMVRLFDLHAIAAAGDTLVTVGLAGTIFFAVPLGEARGNVALYLLITMVPFALLAPLIGPLLDRAPHGRRYALAATMLGRAFLAWLIADHLDGIGLYPAAFGVLVLSRAYGVARAAAVPRLLPRRLGLSQVNARGSVYGTLAGMVVLPLGVAAFWFGPQWPLRVASAIFLVGMVVALRLPAVADSAQPERTPSFERWRHHQDRVLTASRLVTSAVAGSAMHRALYGFLLIFLAFSIRASELPTSIGGWRLGQGTVLGLVSGALVVGTFLAVAAGSRLRIRRPVLLQAIGLALIALVGAVTTAWFVLPLVVLLCVVAAVSSGLAKLTVDSTIQEKLDERLRATAFAHSETLLMLAFVAGSGIGLIPMPGRLGIGVAAGLVLLAALRTVRLAFVLRGDRLSGRPSEPEEPEETDEETDEQTVEVAAPSQPAAAEARTADTPAADARAEAAG